MIRAILVLIATCACLGPSICWAIVVSDPEQEQIVQPGEPAYGINLDGVAALGAGVAGNDSLDDIVAFQCTGALITDQHLLTAAHCLDTDYNGEIDEVARGFWGYGAGFQLPGRELVVKIDIETVRWPTTWPDGETDIAVLELVEAAPPEIPRYALYGASDEIGKQVVLTGYGATGSGPDGILEVPSQATSKRVGLNRFENYLDDREQELGFDFDSGDPAHNVFALQGDESDLGFGAEEVLTAFGDSGGPVFLDGLIAGVSAFNVNRADADFNDEFDQSWGEAAFATRVSRFQDFISNATGGEAVFVPEPGCRVSSIFVITVLAAIARKSRQLR